LLEGIHSVSRCPIHERSIDFGGEVFPAIEAITQDQDLPCAFCNDISDICSLLTLGFVEVELRVRSLDCAYCDQLLPPQPDWEAAINIGNKYRKLDPKLQVLIYFIGQRFAYEGNLVEGDILTSSFFYDRIDKSNRTVRNYLQDLREAGFITKEGQNEHRLLAENLPRALDRVEEAVEEEQIRPFSFSHRNRKSCSQPFGRVRCRTPPSAPS
jgi:ribosomal protein S19E (S16A)